MAKGSYYNQCKEMYQDLEQLFEWLKQNPDKALKRKKVTYDLTLQYPVSEKAINNRLNLMLELQEDYQEVDGEIMYYGEI